METKRRFVIDCDAGLDDAQAILMALAAPEVEIVAITTTHGNTGVDQVCRNVLRLLKMAGRLDIPVYKGAGKALTGWKGLAGQYHGADGFGDVSDPDPDPPSESIIKPEHAVTALLDLVNKHKGELTLMCLGPLTNIALAIRLDQHFGSKLKDCFIMGGNYEGVGNVSPTSEFNFHTDPESAQVTLDELGCHITLVAWELCKKHAFEWEWREHLSVCPSHLASYIDNLEKQTIARYYKTKNPGMLYGTADQLAMALALSDTLAKKVVEAFCVVETSTGITRGQMVVDWNKKLGKEPNVKLVLEVDSAQYGRMIREGLKCTCHASA